MISLYIVVIKKCHTMKSFINEVINAVCLWKVENDLMSKEYIEMIRSKIFDNSTSQDPRFYGANFDMPEDHGTANIVVLAPNGDAVSVTSTVNLLWVCLSALSAKAKHKIRTIH